MYFTSVKSSFNPKYFANFSFSVFNDTNGVSRINGTGTLKEDFIRTLHFLTLKMKLRNEDEDYRREIVKSTIDTCSMSESTFGNLISQHLVETVSKYSNTPLTCPVKAGFYYGRNMPLFFNVSLPDFLGHRIQWELSVVDKGQKSNKSPMLQLFTLKFYGVTD